MSLTLPVLSGSSKTKISYTKFTLSNDAHDQAAALLELHAGAMAYCAMKALAKARCAEFMKASEIYSLLIGLNFIRKAGKDYCLASWLVDNKNDELDENSVFAIEQSNNSLQEKRKKGDTVSGEYFAADESSRLSLRADTIVRRSLGDFDGKGNTFFVGHHIYIIDFGAAISPVMVDFFPPETYKDRYDKSTLQFLDIKKSPGFSEANQLNPFNWLYIPPPSEDQNSAVVIAAEFFIANQSRVPYIGQKKLYEALLEGEQDLDLGALIADTLFDTEVVANSNLACLEMPLETLIEACYQDLIEAANGHLKNDGTLEIDEEKVLSVFEAQRERLKLIAQHQLAIVKNCKESKACLLAYILQNITATDEFNPLIKDPSAFFGNSPAYVMGFFMGKLSEAGREKYGPAIKQIAKAVQELKFDRPISAQMIEYTGITFLRHQEAYKRPPSCIGSSTLARLVPQFGTSEDFLIAVAARLNTGKIPRSDDRYVATLETAQIVWDNTSPLTVINSGLIGGGGCGPSP